MRARDGVHQAVGRASNKSNRWPMQADKIAPRSQRASCAIAVLPSIATTFAMHAMLGRRLRQLKMPRPDAYHCAAAAQERTHVVRLHPGALKQAPAKLRVFACGNGVCQ